VTHKSPPNKMAHNIEVTEQGASFFSNRVPAWHGLGTVVEGAKVWSEAIKLAKMDWQVKKEQDVHPRTLEPINSYSIYREDNDKWLGKVGERYTPIQNEFQFSFMDKILGEGGEHYETAGVLGNGERIFVLANLAQKHDIHGTGDVHQAYLAGMTSHDGSTSARFFATGTRIVCKNTLSIALNGAKGKGVSVRHTKGAETRLNARLKDLQEAKMTFTNTMELLEQLAERKVNSQQVQEILMEVFKAGDDPAEIATRTNNNIQEVTELFENADNGAFPEFKGSPYQLVNAVSEYTDHYREVRMTNGRAELTEELVRAESAMFGGGADFKKRALDIIIAKTMATPSISLHKAYSIPSEVRDGAVLDEILSQAQ
jgi:phage/plasmid-like protein (TIGR03299 family)